MNLCPYGDGMHETDDPYGGPCSECEAYLDEQRRELAEDTMEGMRLRRDLS